jgi:hypothetical protein
VRCPLLLNWPDTDLMSRLLERFHLFTLLYHITDLKSREDMTRIVIGAMDYSMCLARSAFERTCL